MSDEPRGLSVLARLLNAEQATERPHRVIPFPGRRGKLPEEGGLGWRVAIIALAGDDIDAATDDAWKWLTVGLKRTTEFLDWHPDLLDAERKVQQLVRALRDPDNLAAPFGAAIDIRRLHPDERESLYVAFLKWQAERGVFRTAVNMAEVEEKLEALGKDSAPATFLDSYDTVSLHYIITELGRRSTIQREAQTMPPSPDTSSASDSSTESTSG